MEVRIIFKDATAEKYLKTQIMYIQKEAYWSFWKDIGYLNTH